MMRSACFPRLIFSSLQEQEGGAIATIVPFSSFRYGTIATWYFPLGRKWVRRTANHIFSKKNSVVLALDILARVLVEGDVLGVDDGTGGSVVPALLISKGNHVIWIITRFNIIMKLENRTVFT